jgi:hypothetical protein
VAQSERDGWRELAALEGELLGEFELLTHTAVGRLETYDRPPGIGAQIVSIDTVAFTNARIEKVDDEDPTMQGGGTIGSNAGIRERSSPRLRITVTPEYTDANGVARGTSIANLMRRADGGKYQRFTILIVGPMAAALVRGGDLYAPDESAIDVEALEASVLVHRVPIYDPTDGA